MELRTAIMRLSVIAIVTVAITAGVLFIKHQLSSGKKSSQLSNILPKTKAQQTVAAGSFEVEKDSSASAQVGKPLTIYIVADSQKKEIVSYDVVVSLPSDIAELTAQSSLRKDFQLFPYKKDNLVLLTGVRKLSHDQSSVFPQERIIALTIVPKKKGSFEVQILKSAPIGTTGMTSDSNQDMLKDVRGITLDIK